MAECGIPKRVCQDSHTASNMLIRLVMPAKATEMKKNTANRLPRGILANTCGKVMNIKGGPLAGSMPKANTAGMIASPASMAARVSNAAV